MSNHVTFVSQTHFSSLQNNHGEKSRDLRSHPDAGNCHMQLVTT